MQNQVINKQNRQFSKLQAVNTRMLAKYSLNLVDLEQKAFGRSCFTLEDRTGAAEKPVVAPKPKKPVKVTGKTESDDDEDADEEEAEEEEGRVATHADEDEEEDSDEEEEDEDESEEPVTIHLSPATKPNLLTQHLDEPVKKVVAAPAKAPVSFLQQQKNISSWFY